MNAQLKIALLTGLLLLSACTEAKESLGLVKKTPDEFAVVKRAPLEMPPGSQSALPPPMPGAARPQEKTAALKAQEALLGSRPVQNTDDMLSAGEQALLNQANAHSSESGIRAQVDAETLKLRDRNKPVAQKLLGIGGGRHEISASVVNAKAEAERIRKNLEEGKPVTEGETPSIEN